MSCGTSVFALGIAAVTPQRSEELKRIARPNGERPNNAYVMPSNSYFCSPNRETWKS
jgi:hypothetical protein